LNKEPIKKEKDEMTIVQDDVISGGVKNLDLKTEATPEVGTTDSEKDTASSIAARTAKSPASRLEKYKQ
jgi:hypothetical protein